MSWDDIRHFLALMRADSFTEAGRAASVSQSTVSRRIAVLERDLGVTLFSRSSDGITKTADARALMAFAEAMEANVHAMQTMARTREAGVRGTVRITSVAEIVNLAIAPGLGHLRELWPELRIELVASNAIVPLGRKADVAIRLVRPREADVVARRVGRIPYALYAAEEYLRARGGQPLVRMQWLTLDDPSRALLETRWMADVVAAVVGSATDAVPPFLRASDTLALAAAADAGLGLALLPEPIARMHPRLRRLDLDAVVPEVRGERVPWGRDLWLVIHREARDVKRVRVVSEWLASRLSALGFGK